VQVVDALPGWLLAGPGVQRTECDEQDSEAAAVIADSEKAEAEQSASDCGCHGSDSCGGGGAALLGGKLGPDVAPVVGPEVATGEFAVALLLNCRAIGDRDSLSPTIHGLL
jgi:hypothetical protein